MNVPPIPLVGCIAWIPLAVWIVATVHWMIGGEIDVMTGFGSIFVAVGLGYEAMNPPVPQMAPMTVVAVTLTVIMFPFVRAAMNKRALRQIDIEELEKAYAALHGRPDNVLAKIQIAKILFGLGVCGHAMRVVENLMPHMPARFFTEEIRMLKRWHMMGLEAHYFQPITCVECQTSNQAGDVYCRQCGSPYLLDFVKGKVVGTRLGKKLMAAWISMIAVLIGIPAASALPPVPGVLAVLSVLTLASGMVYLAFRDPTGGVAS